MFLLYVASGDQTFAPATIAPAIIYLWRQRVRARVIIWLLVQDSVRTRAWARVRVMVMFGVRFNIILMVTFEGGNITEFSYRGV